MVTGDNRGMTYEKMIVQIIRDKKIIPERIARGKPTPIRRRIPATKPATAKVETRVRNLPPVNGRGSICIESDANVR